jgi:hypothetical protein
VGPYRLEVSAAGFKSYVQSGILLQVGNNVQVNVAMQIGSFSEHVEVMAQAAMLETKENTVSQVIDERRIVDLPLNGRQPTQLVLLSGAALTTPLTCGAVRASTVPPRFRWPAARQRGELPAGWRRQQRLVLQRQCAHPVSGCLTGI